VSNNEDGRFVSSEESFMGKEGNESTNRKINNHSI
jgi:hypothetical protein